MIDAQPTPLNEDWVLLATHYSEASAMIMAGSLEAGGIGAFIVPYRISFLDLGKFGLWVTKEQLEQAQAILSENESGNAQ